MELKIEFILRIFCKLNRKIVRLQDSYSVPLDSAHFTIMVGWLLFTILFLVYLLYFLSTLLFLASDLSNFSSPNRTGWLFVLVPINHIYNVFCARPAHQSSARLEMNILWDFSFPSQRKPLG